MIRFEPDSIGEALLRYVAMAAPDANVYVEISAPDFRLCALLILALSWFFLWRRRDTPHRVTGVLLLLVFSSTASWLLTSGNGRYYVPMLVIVGPLLAGLISQLPFTSSLRLFVGLGLLVLQSWLVVLAPPWDSWAWLRWDRPPYFQVSLPAAGLSSQDTTYVTVSSISYSLIAPQMPAASRWIDIAAGGATPRDERWITDFIGASRRVVLIAPTLAGQVLPSGQPAAAARAAIDALLAPRGLALEATQSCSVQRSQGLARIVGKGNAAPGDPILAQIGFWFCPLQRVRPREMGNHAGMSPRVEAAFAEVERLCPRYFVPGEAATRSVEGGFVRHYGSDTRVYVLDEGTVVYKFWRSLNPVVIGSVDDLLRRAVPLNCSAIRGHDKAWQTGS